MGRFHATKSKVEALNVNPTVAFKVNDAFSIGVGANWQHVKADLGSDVAYGGVAYYGSLQALVAQGLPPALAVATLNAALVPQLGPAGVGTEVPALISGASNAWGWNAGALLKLGEQVHVGVSYRSKISHDVEGTVDFTGAPTISLPGSLSPIGTTLNARFADGPVTTTIDLPDTFSVAAAWEDEKVEILADYTYTGWDSIQSLDIRREGASDLFSSVPLNFENTWRAGLGANVKVNDKFTVRLGTAYDKAPVQDKYRTPRLPDDDRIWAAGGFEWKLSQKATLDFGYAHIFVSADRRATCPTRRRPPRRRSATWWGSTTRRSTSWGCRSRCSSRRRLRDAPRGARPGHPGRAPLSRLPRPAGATWPEEDAEQDGDEAREHHGRRTPAQREIEGLRPASPSRPSPGRARCRSRAAR